MERGGRRAANEKEQDNIPAVGFARERSFAQLLAPDIAEPNMSIPLPPVLALDIHRRYVRFSLEALNSGQSAFGPKPVTRDSRCERLLLVHSRLMQRQLQKGVRSYVSGNAVTVVSVSIFR